MEGFHYLDQHFLTTQFPSSEAVWGIQTSGVWQMKVDTS